MDTIAPSFAIEAPHFSDKIRAKDLDALLQHYAKHIKVLSLDCFDTLLWRNTAAPTDVFYDLQNSPTFKSFGFTAFMRMRAEMNARTIKFLSHNTNEVQLRDIYQNFLPRISAEQLQALEEEEMAAEIAACYAFPPVVELIRKAHALDLKIILVSDTYLTQKQLQRLLEATLPADVMSAIAKIFCSNEYGKSKVNGLFKTVLTDLQMTPNAVLHIGDNPAADLMAAKLLKLNAAHLIHHDATLEELLRLHTTSASLVEPSIRHTRSLASPFRGFFSSSEFATDHPEQMIGYVILGPILYAFARYICDEVKQLSAAGKKPKVLFLMRDAYLPSQVCAALHGEPIGSNVRISRFAALAASFCSVEDVDRYLADNISSMRFAEMAKQLQIPSELANPLIKKAMDDSSPIAKFVQLIHKKDILELIFKKSLTYRKRLISHIKSTIDIAPGDTLMFVDLGYSATTQRLLENILRQELQVEVTGRYLILLSSPQWKFSRHGLLDPSWCDDRAMLNMITYIALLEQLCTSTEKSVVNYDDHGTPLFSESTLSEHQHKNLIDIQNECVRFAKDMAVFAATTQIKLSLQSLRDTAFAGINRLLFLPTEIEINYLQSFEFDLNLGTNEVFKMFDKNQGLTGLKRRGFFSLFMERNSKTYRTNTPAELRSASLELALTFIAQQRYSLDFKAHDLSFRREQLNAIIMRGNESSQITLTAQCTYDGFFSVCIPLNSSELKIGFLFGQHYKWIQIESAELIPAQAFHKHTELKHTEDAWSCLMFNQMDDKGDKLYECVSDAGFAMVIAPQKVNTTKSIFRIVYRPLVLR